ncbi:hypothetical protein, partial [Yoonia sp. R2-816]|uniref:hypothetical protein n=1 Tax=Yoonia sp. R2-816 TaxID=3342638 RepID=UPI00372C9B90
SARAVFRSVMPCGCMSLISAPGDPGPVDNEPTQLVSGKIAQFQEKERRPNGVIQALLTQKWAILGPKIALCPPGVLFSFGCT